MKKYIAIATIALLAGAACSKVETVESTVDTPITFSVVNHLAQTKATDGLKYPTDVPFGTFAWWTSDTWSATTDKQNFVFMNNEKVQYSASEWVPENTYYWTKTGYITFASYSPYTASGTDKGFSEVPAYDVTKGFKFTDYTIVDATNVDLMYANLATDCTKETNETGNDVTNTAGSSLPDDGFKGVPTIFNHALCQVGFAFRAVGTKNPNVESIQVVVTDVDILNIDKKGSFTENNTTKWASDHATRASYEYAPSTALTLDMIDATTEASYTADQKAASYKNDGLSTRILMPQTLLTADANNQQLKVTYTIKIKYTSSTTPAEENVTSTINLHTAGLQAWADNQNITYRITINPYSDTKITFDPAVLNWTDVYSYPETIVPID